MSELNHLQRVVNEVLVKAQTHHPMTEEIFKQETSDQAIRKIKNTDI